MGGGLEGSVRPRGPAVVEGGTEKEEGDLFVVLVAPVVEVVVVVVLLAAGLLGTDLGLTGGGAFLPPGLCGSVAVDVAVVVEVATGEANADAAGTGDFVAELDPPAVEEMPELPPPGNLVLMLALAGCVAAVFAGPRAPPSHAGTSNLQPLGPATLPKCDTSSMRVGKVSVVSSN